MSTMVVDQEGENEVGISKDELKELRQKVFDISERMYEKMEG